jgi:archaetidylinositol phosphate synthase
MMKPVSEHVRENRSALARLEKRTLIWLAMRLPMRVTPDHLTSLGLGAMLLAGLAYWAARWAPGALILAVVALALNWFGDSLDGTVARVRNQERPRYGYYVDHVLDMVGLLFLLGGLAMSGYMSPLVALGVLVAYLMVAAEVFLATCVHGVFRLSSLGVGPTEMRVILAIGTLRLLYGPVIRLGKLGTFLLFDVGGIVAIVGLGLALVVSIARNARALYHAEPLAR